MDFSPMRPDEYLRQDAKYWNELLTLKHAALQGRNAATSEAEAQHRMIELEGERKARRRG